MKKLRRTPIKGSEVPPLPGAKQVRSVNPSRMMGVTLVLRFSLAGTKLDVVDDMLACLPSERRYLDPDEFQRTCGAELSDMKMIERFAYQNQLKVVSHSRAARTVELRGTVASFSRAFRVEPLIFSHPSGFFRSHIGPVCVPSELADVVQAVIGFDTRPQVRRQCVPQLEPGEAGSLSSLSHSPAQVARLYGFPSEVTGRGQNIVFLEFGGGYARRDIRTYFRDLKIPPPAVNWVSVGKAENLPSGNLHGDDLQVTQDIQLAGSIAHSARVTVCFAPNTVRGFLRAFNAMVHHPYERPAVIAIGWNAPEASWNPQALDVLNDCFKAAAALGVTVCCASGNGGSGDQTDRPAAQVDFPASSPYVLACGGTRLQVTDGVLHETVWNGGPGRGASGGGFSDHFRRPAWQEKVKFPGVVNPKSREGRGLPDVAANADPEVGYRARVRGVDLVVGGTGAVVSFWAGLTALINEQIGQPVGFLNPLLYSRVEREGALRDIAEGHNDVRGLVGAYSAVQGWDPCTGLGSPNGVGLVKGLLGKAAQVRKVNTGPIDS